MINTINNNTFNMVTEDISDISVLAAGYIITPDGIAIVVNDNNDHAEVYSEYINRYYEREANWQYYNSTEASQELTQVKHLVYFGIKQKYVSAAYQNNYEGYGVLFLPDNAEITIEQKEILKKLLDSNNSLFGGKRLELEIGSFNGSRYNEDELTEMLISKTK